MISYAFIGTVCALIGAGAVVIAFYWSKGRCQGMTSAGVCGRSFFHPGRCR